MSSKAAYGSVTTSIEAIYKVWSEIVECCLVDSQSVNDFLFQLLKVSYSLASGGSRGRALVLAFT